MEEYAHKLALREICNSRKIESYLEIGVNEGDSLTVVLKNAKELKKLVLCDDWDEHYGGLGKGNNEHIEKLIKDCGYNGAITFFNGDSKESIPNIDDTFDLILVDGDHSAKGAMIDMENAWPLLKINGLMLLDDITHSSHSYLMEVFDLFYKKTNDSTIHLVDRLNKNGVAILTKMKVT